MIRAVQFNHQDFKDLAMAFFPLEKSHRLHDGYQQSFFVDGVKLLLVQEGDDTHLLENRCPHMDSPLTDGNVQSGYIRCPMHGMEFSLSSGESKNGGGGCIKTLELSYEGNQIGVNL